jgi:spore germination cell wall hydrolase CwlJ-like protein
MSALTKLTAFIVLGVIFFTSTGSLHRLELIEVDEKNDIKLANDFINFLDLDLNALTVYDKSQVQCLADSIYFEAGNQSSLGKIAVANVVMNRVNHKNFPNNICDVVYQRSESICQFSWACKKPQLNRQSNHYQSIKFIAIDSYLGIQTDITDGSLFFHSKFIDPNWNLKRTFQIEDHIFYKYRH